MVQVKIYGLKEYLNPIKAPLSDAVHSCIMDALQYPADKRAHRFFSLDKSDFFYPAGRTDRYTIMVKPFGISGQDLETTIFETPKHNWGFRGLPGDEHQLNYTIEV
jgi:hypothetical protein